MYQAFMVVLREGIEAFLIVAIVFAYLRKTHQRQFLGAVTWGIFGAILVSGLLGYFLWVTQGTHQPFLEGIFASVTVVLVSSFVVHMWKIGPTFKKSVEKELSEVTAKPNDRASYVGILIFTILMIAREGMEMMLLLFQIRDPQIVIGIALGAVAAAVIAILWQQFGYLINMKKFFQITSIFLLLFTLQIAVQAFHEFTEAGVFPNSEALHIATEPYSTAGLYGKWYGNLIFMICGLWLIGSLFLERLSQGKKISSE